MSSFTGLFDLQSVPDLMRKLRHDLVRIEASPSDTYAAFDFFVTAEHLVDWLHPTDEQARRALRNGNVLLRVTSHIANGAKHFEAKAKHHRSVASTEKFKYVEDGYIEPGYFAEPLLIHLTAEEARELGAPVVDVPALARRVVDFWNAHIPSS